MGLLRNLFGSKQKVLGVPVGPKRTDWDKVAKAAVGAVAAGGAAVSATAAAKKLGDKGGDLAEKGKEAVEKGKDVIGTGKDLRDKAASVGDAMSGSSTAVGKAVSAVKELGSSDGSAGDSSSGRYTEKQRLIIREQIEVAVPRKVAYNQWTQFEDFPNIFRGVDSVEQVDDETVAWTGKILWSTRTWRARITEQIPDELIRWVTKGGVNHKGVVTFHEIDGNLTRVQLEMEYFPRGFVEKFGNLFLTARHRVRKDLRLFKHFIELEGEPTGAWRGAITKDGPGTGEDDGPTGTGDVEDDEQPRNEDTGDQGSPDDESKDDESNADGANTDVSGNESSKNDEAQERGDPTGNGKADAKGDTDSEPAGTSS